MFEELSSNIVGKLSPNIIYRLVGTELNRQISVQSIKKAIRTTCVLPVLVPNYSGQCLS